MTRRQLLRATDSAELLEWRVLEGLDPWGQRRDDWRMARLAAQLAAFLGAKNADGKVPTADELVLTFAEPTGDDETEGQTPDEIARHLAAWVTAHNAGAARKGGTG